MARSIKTMEGLRFGRLMVIGRAGRDTGGSVTWSCRCDCGTPKVARGYSLRRGDTKSCGCLVHEQPNHRQRFTHAQGCDGAKAFYFYQYQRNAKHRSRSWELSLDQFVALISSPCHYCGAPPQARPAQRGRASIQASGVDRKNNEQGYTPTNSVACCTWCNRAKSNLSSSDFIKQCQGVAANAAIARNEVHV